MRENIVSKLWKQEQGLFCVLERAGESWRWPPAPGPGDRGGHQGPVVRSLDEVRPGPRIWTCGDAGPVAAGWPGTPARSRPAPGWPVGLGSTSVVPAGPPDLPRRGQALWGGAWSGIRRRAARGQLGTPEALRTGRRLVRPRAGGRGSSGRGTGASPPSPARPPLPPTSISGSGDRNTEGWGVVGGRKLPASPPGLHAAEAPGPVGKGSWAPSHRARPCRASGLVGLLESSLSWRSVPADRGGGQGEQPGGPGA